MKIEMLAIVLLPSSDKNHVLSYAPREAFTDIGVLPFTDEQRVQMTVQYFDGLGRPLQTVQAKASPDRAKDLVQPVAYDGFGRESRKYLPYAASGNSGKYKGNALTAILSYYNPSGGSGPYLPNGVARISSPYAETVFDLSPLNRVLEQGAPGDAWQPAATRGTTGRTVVMGYGTNNAIDFGVLTDMRKVARYGVSLDANGVPTLILDGAYAADHLYLTISKDENWTAADGRNGTVEEYRDKQDRVVLKRTFNKNHLNADEMLSTYYLYDDFDNLSFVLPPGVDPDRATLPTATELDDFAYRYRYDGRRRMIEKQLPGKGVEYIVYNKQDLPILTQDANQRLANTWLFSKYDALGRAVMSGKATIAGGRAAIQLGADTLGSPWEIADNSNLETGYLGTTRTYPVTDSIDHYLTINYYDGYGFPGAALVAAQGDYSKKTKGLPTGSKVYTTGGQTSYLSASYYDSRGRVIEAVSQNHVNGMDRIVNTYNFPGELVSSIRTHTGHGQTTVIGTNYTYDHMGRKLKTEINDPNQKVVLSELTYNEIGQLKEKKIHSEDDGNTFLTRTGYTYNARGWLKQQNNELFTMELNYEDAVNVQPQYNGNIGDQYWGPSSNVILHNYSYLYDKLNRLTGGISDEGFNETIDYDKMGNITSLTRDLGGTPSIYAYSGNRLSSIAGAVNSSYGYDVNGNQISDSEKGLTIGYNYLNLPEVITKASTSETMTNSWLSTGAKISKTVGGVTRDYAGGIEYSDGILEFVQTEEGRAIPIGSSGYSYEYLLKDHLGNTRLLLKENGSTLETSDYYPFGLQVSRSGQTVTSPENHYKYNGKELQTELGLGQYDYGTRFYDPVVGRWNVPDMLAELAHDLTPYRYCYNNPINYIDPYGLWERLHDGFFTDDEEEIKRFTLYLDVEGQALKNNPSFSQMSSFIEGEMSQGLGALSDGSKLANEFSANAYRQVGGGIRGYADSKSFNNFWHGVQGALTPDALDPRSLNRNYVGSYPGPNNPKKYNGDYDYSYIPSNIVEFPVIKHDLAYDRLGISGKSGLFISTKAIEADWTFVKEQMGIGVFSPDMKTKLRAYGLGILLGTFATPKTLLNYINKDIIQPAKATVTLNH